MEDKELIIIALAAVGLLSLVIVGAAVLLVSTYPEILAGAGSQKNKNACHWLNKPGSDKHFE